MCDQLDVIKWIADQAVIKWNDDQCVIKWM
jgi:hypothetical protein